MILCDNSEKVAGLYGTQLPFAFPRQASSDCDALRICVAQRHGREEE